MKDVCVVKRMCGGRELREKRVKLRKKYSGKEEKVELSFERVRKKVKTRKEGEREEEKRK